MTDELPPSADPPVPPPPQGMTRPELVELVLICFATYGAWVVADASRWTAGRLLLFAAALLLAQGFCRDLWLLVKRHRDQTRSTPRTARCMCVESTLGMASVVAGALMLLVFQDPYPVTLSAMQWSVLVLAVLGTGFALKDWVLAWAPLRLRKESDHSNIIPTFWN